MSLKGKILIVDDEPINLDFFDVMLSRLGFEVVMAEDGEEALEMIQQDKPDLIILDNIMPKMTGWELTKILKKSKAYEQFRDIPIIMFSAMDAVKDKIEGFELGIEDYITKPFNFSEVLARIRAVLRNKELAHQVVNRERRIALIESLNQSLLYFTDHLKRPMDEMITTARSLDLANQKNVGTFQQLVIKEGEEVLAALEGLRDEIHALKSEGDKLKQSEVTLQDLEEKFQKHFNGTSH
ncbi:MAG: response regulator [Spirochaetales bacterium]